MNECYKKKRKSDFKEYKEPVYSQKPDYKVDAWSCNMFGLLQPYWLIRANRPNKVRYHEIRMADIDTYAGCTSEFRRKVMKKYNIKVEKDIQNSQRVRMTEWGAYRLLNAIRAEQGET